MLADFWWGMLDFVDGLGREYMEFIFGGKSKESIAPFGWVA